MWILSSRRNENYCVVSTVLIFLLFIAPLSAFAQDTKSINTLRQMGKAFATIADKASPAVVGIKVEKTIIQQYQVMPDWPFGEPFNPFGDDFFNRFFRQNSPRQQPKQRKYRQIAQGSGFIISPDGYILTNNHLIGEADKVTVKLRKEPEIEAKVIGTDPESDVAVIKIDSKEKLPCLQLADSNTIEVGQWVIAIGNPFGLSHTVTAGIISAKGRSNVGLATYEDYIQTDAAINPGNSGGPLLNLDGKVVGINTAIISRSGGFVGIGFAIPINMAKAIYKELVDTGKVVRGFLGVGIQDMTPQFAQAFGLSKDTKGVLVPEVQEGSAAEKAGLKYNDIIVEFNGHPVDTANNLRNKVAMLKPGTTVKVVVLRDGKRKTLTVKLGKRPPKGEVTAGQTQPLEKLGFSVRDLTDDLAQRYGYQDKSGVIVTRVEPGSQAARLGITPGTLIMEVNRKQVTNTKEFNEAIGDTPKGAPVLLLITDGQYTRFVVLKLPEK